MKSIYYIGLTVLILSATSCRKEGCTDSAAGNFDLEAKKDDGSCEYQRMIDVPSTYTFTDAEGNSTVSYSGQTDRINMLVELKSYMDNGHTQGTVLNKQKLLDMYSNSNSPFTSNGLNSSTKQLESKTFSLDVDLFKQHIDSIVSNSMSTTAGSNGVAGVVTSNSGAKKYLMSSNGWEYAQIIEKGLMGAVLYYQISEVYTRDGKIGDAVDNTVASSPEEGKYYTDMEHHWDEAFGYFGAPTDFPTNADGLQFIAKYANGRNAVLSRRKNQNWFS